MRTEGVISLFRAIELTLVTSKLWVPMRTEGVALYLKLSVAKPGSS